MAKLNLQERMFIVEWFFKYKGHKTNNLTATLVQQKWLQVYQRPAPFKVTILKIIQKFETCGEVTDRKRSGRPRTAVTKTSVAQVHNVLLNEPSTTQRQISKQLKIAKGSICRIIKEIDVEQVWTPEDIESLISLVRPQNPIYDKSHPDYNKRELIDTIWKEIALQLKRTSESCSKKWQVLRIGYQKRKNSQKFDSTKVIKWPYFPSLDFLKDYIQDIPNDRTPTHSLNHIHNQPSGVSQYRPEPNYPSEEIFLNENNYNNLPTSEEFVCVKTEIQDDESFTEMQNHNENEMETLDNIIDNISSINSQENEMEGCNKVEDYGIHVKPEPHMTSKNNSMELFLLSLVEDASSLSKIGQREFKSKTLALLHSLE